MIKVNKTLPAPVALKKSHAEMGALINKILSEGKVAVLSTKGTKGAQKAALPANGVKVLIDDDKYKPVQAKALLKTDQFGKCAFCEARFMDTAGGDVEHFRPKKRRDGFVPMQGKAIENLGYFQYVYDWNNHLLSCKECNQANKKNYFDHIPDNDLPPDEDDYATADEFWSEMVKWGSYKPAATDDWNMLGAVVETPVLINPLTENPREFINFNVDTAEAHGCMLDDQNQDMSQGNVSARGGKSILVLGLNRRELVYARARHLALLRGVFLDMTRNLDQAIEFLVWQRGPNWANTATALTLRQWVKYPLWRVRQDPLTSSLDFLRYSTTPCAPFSALAMDAMAVWGRELCLHLIQPQQHFTQLQQADTGNPLATRSVNNLLSLGMHTVVLNAYQSDRKAIKELDDVITRFNPLWSAGLVQSEIEFVCRKRLHVVMALHAAFYRDFASKLDFSTRAYQTAWLAHSKQITEVYNALRAYECDSNTWDSAIKDMEDNMAEYAVDLAYDLIPKADVQLTQLTQCVESRRADARWAADLRWQTAVLQCLAATQHLSTTLANRVLQCMDEDDKNTAVSLNAQLQLMLDALATLQKGSVPVDVPSPMEGDLLADWETPVATKVMKVPANYDQHWQHISANSPADVR